MRWKEHIAQAVFDWQFREPIGKSEVIECPMCQGRLRMDQMKESGFVNGACETPGCVVFSLPPLARVRELAKELGITRYD